MVKTKLLMRLRDLHEELASMNDDLKSTEHVDEETIDALGQLVTDVGGLVDQTRQNVDAENRDVAEHHQLLDQIMRFESHHPRVVSFLSQMTDVLTMIGI